MFRTITFQEMENKEPVSMDPMLLAVRPQFRILGLELVLLLVLREHTVGLFQDPYLEETEGTSCRRV